MSESNSKPLIQIGEWENKCIMAALENDALFSLVVAGNPIALSEQVVISAHLALPSGEECLKTASIKRKTVKLNPLGSAHFANLFSAVREQVCKSMFIVIEANKDKISKPESEVE